jgi:3-deoxy-D-manno-octulosonate 8-phosphate phosphatase (KDO 8-P phosphatase)
MNLLDRFKKIRCFVFDVDGVLTDGSILLLPGGEWARTMNIRDGYALQLAVREGFRVLVISGGDSDAVRQRLERLGIGDVFLKETNKAACLQQYLLDQGLEAAEVLYMGDDIPDLEAMALAGLPCCPADAAPEIRSRSLFISSVPGGKGCAREVIEKVLKLQGHWPLQSVPPGR